MTRAASPATFAVGLLAPTPASAHLVSTGFGPVTDGIAHFLLSPDAFLPMSALALAGGLRGPAHARGIVFTVPVVWLATVLAGLAPPAALRPFATAAGFLIAGALAAADLKLPRTALLLIAAVLSVLWGSAYNGATAAENPPVLAALGGAFAIFALLALVASAALSIRKAWARIAFRVLGSWTAAIGLLVAGWTIHSGA